eukprot:Hpha_TRINITY_DN16543_c0_g3::TRINITY_DN16543_c0_g3_i1::g.136088::m.136088
MRLVFPDEHFFDLFGFAPLAALKARFKGKRWSTDRLTSREGPHRFHDSKLALRITKGPSRACIEFHFDAGGAHCYGQGNGTIGRHFQREGEFLHGFNTYQTASHTLQMPLNPRDEYDGGELLFLSKGQLYTVEREVGSLSSHGCDVFHAVRAVHRGIRKSLFVVDYGNSLGEEGVKTVTAQHIVDFRAAHGDALGLDPPPWEVSERILFPRCFHREIPFSELTLQEQISRGAFKTVHRGEWSKLPGKTTAILKVPKVEVGAEVDIMNTIGRHPHLLLFYGVSHRDADTFFVVEYAPLRSLREHLLDLEEQGEAPTPIVGVECALQVASGMM